SLRALTANALLETIVEPPQAANRLQSRPQVLADLAWNHLCQCAGKRKIAAPLADRVPAKRDTAGVVHRVEQRAREGVRRTNGGHFLDGKFQRVVRRNLIAESKSRNADTDSFRRGTHGREIDGMGPTYSGPRRLWFAAILRLSGDPRL